MERSGLSGIRRYRIPESITGLLRLFVGGIFLLASIPKMNDLGGFFLAIENYRMLPAEWVPFLATILISLEFVTGFFLIAGIYKKECAIIVIALNIMFIGALSQAMFRGIDISCGCFSVNGESITYLDIIRDIVLILFVIPLLSGGVKHVESSEKKTECQAI